MTTTNRNDFPDKILSLDSIFNDILENSQRSAQSEAVGCNY